MREASVRIGARAVGTWHPCYVIAEAGSNHDGSLAQAKELIDVAGAAGADAVKFQLFRAARLYPKNAGVSGYLRTDTPIYDIISRLEMPYEWLPELAARCETAGVDLLVSPFDEESADRLDPYVKVFKIASYEMTHLPLVQHIARKGTPVIISTGTATLDEVEATVAAFAETGNTQLVLMQCTAAYPAPLDALNIRAITTLRARFGVPVGLSDHSRDPIVGPVVAVACGAAVVEKHYTLSNTLPGPDHRFALEPDELRRMVAAVREAEVALGSGEKVTAPVEQELRSFARRSLFARHDIPAGEVFTTENLVVLRCGQHDAGLSPADLARTLGRRAARHISGETVVRAGDVSQ